MLEKSQVPVPLLLEDIGMYYPTANAVKKRRYGIYKCYCGKEFRAMAQSIKSGNTISCGCYHIEQASQQLTSHGMSGTRLYKIYRGMKDRVLNIKCSAFEHYGGRGIKICSEWEGEFVKFYDWAIANGYDDDLTIDRINNDGNYEPSNCRWVSMTVQNRNTSLLYSHNTSGYRGVCFDKRCCKYISSIGIGGKRIRLGMFDTAIDAAKKYDSYVLENNLEHTINGVI
jgi:hypothetical protein